MKRTIGNKICAIAMIAAGWLVTMLSGDATALVFLLMFAVPMFFAWEQWIF
jgi:cytochrome b561